MTADSLKLRYLTIGFPLHGWINNYNECGIYSSWWCHTYMCKYCLFVCMYTTWQCMCTCMFQYWKFLWYRLSWHLISWLHGNIMISPNPKVVIPIDCLPLCTKSFNVLAMHLCISLSILLFSIIINPKYWHSLAT